MIYLRNLNTITQWAVSPQTNPSSKSVTSFGEYRKNSAQRQLTYTYTSTFRHLCERENVNDPLLIYNTNRLYRQVYSESYEDTYKVKITSALKEIANFMNQFLNINIPADVSLMLTKRQIYHRRVSYYIL